MHCKECQPNSKKMPLAAPIFKKVPSWQGLEFSGKTRTRKVTGSKFHHQLWRKGKEGKENGRGEIPTTSLQTVNVLVNSGRWQEKHLWLGRTLKAANKYFTTYYFKHLGNPKQATPGRVLWHEQAQVNFLRVKFMTNECLSWNLLWSTPWLKGSGKPSLVVHTCNAITWDPGAEASCFQDKPELQSLTESGGKKTEKTTHMPNH